MAYASRPTTTRQVAPGNALDPSMPRTKKASTWLVLSQPVLTRVSGAESGSKASVETLSRHTMKAVRHGRHPDQGSATAIYPFACNAKSPWLSPMTLDLRSRKAPDGQDLLSFIVRQIANRRRDTPEPLPVAENCLRERLQTRQAKKKGLPASPISPCSVW